MKTIKIGSKVIIAMYELKGTVKKIESDGTILVKLNSPKYITTNKNFVKLEV